MTAPAKDRPIELPSLERWRFVGSFVLYPVLIATTCAAELAPPFVANIAAFAMLLVGVALALVGGYLVCEGNDDPTFARDIERYRAEKANGLLHGRARRLWGRFQILAWIAVMAGFGWWWTATIAAVFLLLFVRRGQEIVKRAEQ